MYRIDWIALAGGLALMTCGLPSDAAFANDSSVELSVGGLVFASNPDVSMESQELRITPDTVTVRYQVLNHGAQPVTLAISFPLPEIDLSEFDTLYAFSANDPANFVGFQTKVDGKPVKFDIVQKAYLGDKDITASVRAAALPMLPMGTQRAAIGALSQQARDKLVNDGVLLANGTDQSGQTLYNGSWTVKTSATRQQTFPPGKPVVVELLYRTSVGITFDTVLRKAVRESRGMTAEFQRYKTDYCIPDGLLRGIDRIAGPTEANTGKLQERRIAYALKGGAAPPAPIKDFRLVIDKGRADRLVSFCADNVKKISATAFEMRAKDFTPERDLKILLITKVEGQVPSGSQPDAPLLNQSGGRTERFD